MSLQLVVKTLRHITNTGVNFHTHLRYFRFHFISSQVNVLKCGGGYAEKSLGRPFCEPIYCTAVDKRGEHTTSRAERTPDRAHTENYMQVVSETNESLYKTHKCKRINP